jgi:hypothetical protein
MPSLLSCRYRYHSFRHIALNTVGEANKNMAAAEYRCGLSDPENDWFGEENQPRVFHEA